MAHVPIWNLTAASLAKTWLFGPGIFILLLLGAIGLLLLPSSRKAIMVIYLAAVTGLFYVYFSPVPGRVLGDPLLNQAREMELEAVPAECARTVKTIVVLGGGLALPGEPSSATVSRLNEAARLLRSLSEHNQARDVIVAGGPTWPGSQASEADAGVTYLRMTLGEAAKNHLFFEENRSLNTMQNAAFTRALMMERKMPLDIVLITGAYHLPRATLTFKRQDFRVCPHAAPEPPVLHEFSLDNAVRTFMVINEWVGRFAYQLHGWS